MKLNWRSLVSLKVSVIIAFIIIWNMGFYLAMYLGGGGLSGGLTPIGLEVSGYTCLLASIFSLSVAMLKPIQGLLIAPSRASNFSPKEFYFLALVAGFLAVSRLAFPVAAVGSNAL
jgi:hypothetical protein